MPPWLEQVDREVSKLLAQGILERGENDWSYDLVFSPAPLPAAYDADPYDMTQLWPDPLLPEDVVKLAKDHESEAVVAVEHLTILVTFITHDSNAQQLVRDGNAIYQIDEPHQVNRMVELRMKFGFRSYDGRTGEPIDQRIIERPDLEQWFERRRSPAPFGADQIKLGLAQGLLIQIARELDTALIAEDIEIH